jgi:hypothetical protein
MTRTERTVGALALAFVLLAARPAGAQWQLETKDGQAAIKVGFLVQPQGEWLETSDNSNMSQNVFLRRLRILFGGHVSEKWTFFFETDIPNIGRANPDRSANPLGAKDAGDIYIQDAYVTYTHKEALKVDVGMMLPPLSHNHNQSAATLLTIDYGPYSFMESGWMAERVGRDYGVQVRGYPAKQRIEYRLGVFQGVRGIDASNPLRFTGRAVYYPFGADTGMFYAGTFQGTRKIIGIGTFLDVQKAYRGYGSDVFYEQPFGKQGHGATVQLDWTHFDGGTFLPMPKQDVFLVEAGYHWPLIHLTPFVQYAVRYFAQEELADTDHLQLGIAWWGKGHSRNVKVSAGRQHVSGRANRLQVLAQLQIFFF